MVTKAELYRLRTLRQQNISKKDRKRIVDIRTQRAVKNKKKQFRQEQVFKIKNEISVANKKLSQVEKKYNEEWKKLDKWRTNARRNARTSSARQSISESYNEELRGLRKNFQPQISQLRTFTSKLSNSASEIMKGKLYSFNSVKNYAKSWGDYAYKKVRYESKKSKPTTSLKPSDAVTVLGSGGYMSMRRDIAEKQGYKIMGTQTKSNPLGLPKKNINGLSQIQKKDLKINFDIKKYGKNKPSDHNLFNLNGINKRMDSNGGNDPNRSYDNKRSNGVDKWNRDNGTNPRINKLYNLNNFKLQDNKDRKEKIIKFSSKFIKTINEVVVNLLKENLKGARNTFLNPKFQSKNFTDFKKQREPEIKRDLEKLYQNNNVSRKEFWSFAKKEGWDKTIKKFPEIKTVISTVAIAGGLLTPLKFGIEAKFMRDFLKQAIRTTKNPTPENVAYSILQAVPTALIGRSLIKNVKINKNYKQEFKSYNQAKQEYDSLIKLSKVVDKTKNVGGVAKTTKYNSNKLTTTEIKDLQGIVKTKIINPKKIKEVEVTTSSQKFIKTLPEIKKIITQKNKPSYYRVLLKQKTFFQNSVTYGIRYSNGKIKYITLNTISPKAITQFRNLRNALRYGRQKTLILSKQKGNYILSREFYLRGKKLRDKANYISRSKKIKGMTRTTTKKIGKVKRGSVKQLYKISPKVSKTKSKTKKIGNTKITISKTKINSVVVDMSYLKKYMRIHNKALARIKNKTLRVNVIKLKKKLINPTNKGATKIRISKRFSQKLEQVTKKKIKIESRSVHQVASSIPKKLKVRRQRFKQPMKKKLKTKMLPRTKTKSKTKQTTKNKHKQDTKQTTTQATKQGSATKTKGISKPRTKLIPRTILSSKSKLVVRRPIPPKKSNTKRVIFSKTKKKKTFTKTSSKSKIKGYNVLVKEEISKKWVKVNDKVLNKKLAHDLGSYLVDHSLGTQFKLRSSNKQISKSDLRISRGYFLKVKAKFRAYKKRQGRRVKMKNRYIEKRRRRLDTRSEVKKISVRKKLAELKKPKRKKRKKVFRSKKRVRRKKK